MGAASWTVRLSATAEADFRQILRWTADRFGAAQARIYADTISLALQDLSAGTTLIGVKARAEIGASIYTLHIARHGRKARHFVMFRASSGEGGAPAVDVLRLLHDGMDLERHWPPPDEAS
ncbi:type II toxin-antitoxin system RelE/ParE family toxin [Roseateles sp.]|uniref:type II toxin-antitoxin system RelE/ParE family toxin n=1 Tax=Roseateles sp. TaxID=1971397 RepID=UPI00286CBC70|nr:type II toxin-antitoxin system RelE/ParE family toxin [Roseateles sp.]